MKTTTPKRRKAPVLRDVPAVSRAIAILRLLGRSNTPLGVQVIAKQLGLIPSTCLHILRVLAAEQLVSVDSSTKYSLSAGTVALARTALHKRAFVQLVQKHLDELSEAYGVTAIGVEALGADHMIVVALSKSQAALRIHVDVGSRFPLLISATGRCVAAFGQLKLKDIEKRFHTLRWDNPPTLAEWRTEVEQTRIAGYGIDDGRYLNGITIIAAPVFMKDGAMSFIVMVGIRDHLRRIGFDKIGAELRAHAEKLSQALGEAA
jgi:DNA-binding IclR family transcriptional regulator